MSQQINLYNPRFRKKKNYLTANTLAALLGVALAGSLAVGVSAQRRAAVLQAESDRLQRQVEATEASKKAVAGLAPRQRSTQVAQDLAQAESDNRALQRVSHILDKGEMGNTRGYSAYFSAFARGRVQGLWLTGVQIIGAGNEISLQGRTLQASLLPGYLQGLAREPVLKGKTFAHLEMGQPKTVAGAVAQGLPPAASAASASAAAPKYVEFSLQALPVVEVPARAEAK